MHGVHNEANGTFQMNLLLMTLSCDIYGVWYGTACDILH